MDDYIQYDTSRIEKDYMGKFGASNGDINNAVNRYIDSQ